VAVQKELRKQRRTQVAAGPVSAEIIEREAVRLFGERTYPAVGMRDISDAVGLLPGSLYAHISSKEELLVRISEQGIRNYLDVIAPIAESEQPAGTRLREVIKAHMRVLSTTLEQTRVAFHQWTYLGAERQQGVIALRRRYEELIARILDDGVRTGEFQVAGNPRIAVLATIGMLNSATEWYSPAGPLGPDEIGEAIAGNALMGLQK
jgi:AcrR family transcriptional regulator